MISYAFHPEAEAEIAAAVLFYESRVGGLGRAFMAEVERVITLVREYPVPEHHFGCRFEELLSIAFRTR